jgi:hypothetical protein
MRSSPGLSGLRNEGPTLAPLNAFLLLQGLETLPVRPERYLAGRYPSIVTWGASGGRDASIRFFDNRPRRQGRTAPVSAVTTEPLASADGPQLTTNRDSSLGCS